MKEPAAFLLLALGVIADARGAVAPFQPCKLENPVHLSLVQAECTVLSVPESPAVPGGRHISLKIARVPAVNRRKQADPIFVIAGGPGMAASVFYAGVAPFFERIHRDRDIVLVDQRGTGGSNALTCALTDDDLYRSSDADLISVTRRCLNDLSAHADAAMYTTSIAVRDLDQVRSALGYAHINLYAVSYGTRVAQQYLRRYGEHVRSVILDGVVSPQRALGPDIALAAESALLRIFDRCRTEPSCAGPFGDPTQAYHALRDRLQAHAVPVVIPDPTSGEPARLEFSSYHFATVLRLASYTSEQAALLPWALHVADQSQNYGPLAAQFLLVNRAYGDAVAYGMHNTVVCSEDVPFFDPQSLDRHELEKTYLGTTQIDGLKNICAAWPRGPVDPDFHAPLHSDVPALLLSGTDDPATPPAYAEEAARGLTHSLRIVLTGFGHGQLTAPCIDRVMARFLERGSVDQLDIACTRAAKPMPFFISINGPPP